MADDKLAIPIIPPAEAQYSMENETAFRREMLLMLFAIDGALARQRETIEDEVVPAGTNRGDLILNPDFSEGTGEGSYWATQSASTANALAVSPTVGGGVDFIADATPEVMTLWQVTDVGGDITKTVDI